MKDSIITYQTWAPDETLWTPWVKPVLFANAPRSTGSPVTIPRLKWVTSVERDTIFILDLPGKTGVEAGLAFAQLGYRPIPLYNGVQNKDSKSMIVDVKGIAAALFEGANILKSCYIRPTAPPVFLLDFNRLVKTGKRPGMYDNRWCIFPQDMPSATFLKQHGIRRVVVYSERIQEDLAHILCRYQKEGIDIYLCNDSSAMMKVNVKKPSQYKGLFYRIMVISGLTRNAAGGFGGMVPEPQASSGYHYRAG